MYPENQNMTNLKLKLPIKAYQIFLRATDMFDKVALVKFKHSHPFPIGEGLERDYQGDLKNAIEPESMKWYL